MQLDTVIPIKRHGHNPELWFFLTAQVRERKYPPKLSNETASDEEESPVSYDITRSGLGPYATTLDGGEVAIHGLDDYRYTGNASLICEASYAQDKVFIYNWDGSAFLFDFSHHYKDMHYGWVSAIRVSKSLRLLLIMTFL